MTTSIKRNIYLQHEVTIFNFYVDKTLNITFVCAGSIVTMADQTDRHITRLRDYESYCRIRNISADNREWQLKRPKANIAF